MRRFLAISLLLIPFLVGCTVQRQSSETATILSVFGYEGNMFSDTVFVQSVDSVPILLDKGCILSNISDMCMSDHSLFVLDASSSIFRFNSLTGKQEKSIRKVGHAKDEYIMPVAMTCSNGMLYVLDLQGRKIVCYDYNLNYLKTILLEFSAMDIAKVKGGFLLFNPSPSEDLGMVVLADSLGKSKNSFLQTDMVLDQMTWTKCFSEAADGKIYYTDPSSNRIYLWENNAMREAYTLDFGQEEKEGRKSSDIIKSLKANTLYTLFSSNYIIAQFTTQKFVSTFVYNMNDGTRCAGLVSTGTGFPFMPRMVHGNCLVGLYENPHYFSGHNYTLIFYNLR